MQKLVEIRSYRLKPGSGAEFERVVREESVPCMPPSASPNTMPTLFTLSERLTIWRTCAARNRRFTPPPHGEKAPVKRLCPTPMR